MHYTIRDVPKEVDEALKARAEAEGKSVSEVALEVLKQATSISGNRKKRRDLSDIAGTWIHDPAVEAALRDQDQVDAELWK